MISENQVYCEDPRVCLYVDGYASTRVVNTNIFMAKVDSSQKKMILLGETFGE